MIERHFHLGTVTRLLGRFPVVGLLGARQVGKTTLAAAIAHNSKVDVIRFDLEDPAAVSRLADPMLALGGLRGLVILDEVQNRPELFPSLRVLADRRPVRARFLVLGSASPQLLRQSSESLAGRIAYHLLPGSGLAEVPDMQWNRLCMRCSTSGPDGSWKMHSKAGASWEGFIIDQIIQALETAQHECFFWRTHAGAELDLLVVRGARRIGVEVKRTTAPALTPSKRSAMTDLKLTQLCVVHAGEGHLPIGEKAAGGSVHGPLESGRITEVRLVPCLDRVQGTNPHSIAPIATKPKGYSPHHGGRFCRAL
jgi:predicted AAA+ superfamily ATPase